MNTFIRRNAEKGTKMKEEKTKKQTNKQTNKQTTLHAHAICTVHTILSFLGCTYSFKVILNSTA